LNVVVCYFSASS